MKDSTRNFQLEELSYLNEEKYRLLIIDGVISKDNASHPAKWKDLMMMVVYGSRERTEREFQNLLGGAGFKLKRVTALPLPDALIEAVPV